jgi:tripeptide aminopeptidase
MATSSSLVNRFLKYVTFDTRAIQGTGLVPSSAGQLDFGKHLADELQKIGLEDACCDEHAYVIATLPSNTNKDVPTVALIAHMDTAFEVTGRDVNARIIKYDGGDIVLNETQNILMTVAEFPDLAKFQGQELIVTDGTTLLGADDKAGVAAIVEAVEWLARHPEAKHGTIKVVFTPDEEIGHLAAFLDLEKLGAKFAYTIDASDVGELCWETFNAAMSKVKIKGRSVHPGKAKNKMKNAGLMLLEFLSMLPEGERPETTEGREGFFHVIAIRGDVEDASAEIFIRDHDRSKFEMRKERLLEIGRFINEKYGKNSCSVDTNDQYYNMGEKLRDMMHVVEYARESMKRLGIEPVEIPVRGGTDGSALSWRGLPTPNIFKGAMNNHGRFEYLPVDSLEKCCAVVKNLAQVIAEKP